MSNIKAARDKTSGLFLYIRTGTKNALTVIAWGSASQSVLTFANWGSSLTVLSNRD
jgi:hypothetical protein